MLETSIESSVDYVQDGESLPQISVSASRNAAGAVHVTLCNLDSRSAAAVTITLAGQDAIRQVAGRVLTAPEMTTHNTFSQPEAVKPADLQTLTFAGQQVNVQLAPMAVAVLAICRTIG